MSQFLTVTIILEPLWLCYLLKYLIDNYPEEQGTRTLNRITLNVVNSDFNEDNFTISVPFLNKDLLLLSKDFKASNNERILYRIVGGDFALDSDGGNARLEFRRLPNSDACIIALQEYEPTLPWWVYKYT